MKLLHVSVDNKLTAINLEKKGNPDIVTFVKQKLNCDFVDIGYVNQKTRMQFCVLFNPDAEYLGEKLNKFATIFLNQGHRIYGDAFICFEIKSRDGTSKLSSMCDYEIIFLKRGFNSIPASLISSLEIYENLLD